MKPEKLNQLFLQHLTPISRLHFVGERLQDIVDMLEEISYEISSEGVEAED
jgi:hypothetical protein